MASLENPGVAGNPRANGYADYASGTQSWEWLHVDDLAQHAVSADGQTIEGRFSAPLPGGYVLESVWKFTAVRE